MFSQIHFTYIRLMFLYKHKPNFIANNIWSPRHILWAALFWERKLKTNLPQRLKAYTH